MRVEHVLPEALAEEHLRLTGVDRVRHETDHVELELRQGAAHLVELVLGLGDDLVEAVVDRPAFLLFGQRPEMPLAAPVAARAADPLIQDPAPPEVDAVFELGDQIGQLGIALDLTQLVGVVAAPCVTQLKLTFGPVVSLNYDSLGGVEQVFVTTVGGLGTVAPSSVDKTGGVVTFNFNTPVCAGSSPGKGDTSYFFGLASNQSARAVTATVVPTLGGSLSLNARAPKLLLLPPPGGLKPRPKPPGR